MQWIHLDRLRQHGLLTLFFNCQTTWHNNPENHDFFIATVSQLSSEYAIRRVKENLGRFEMYGTHHFLPYANNVNMLDENTFTTKKNTEALL
jgi:hypothetical protein